MFEKTNRSGLIIYLYYNRDAKKIQEYGDICYHSKKHRYLQLYVPTEELDDLVERLGKERYIKKIRRCHIQELESFKKLNKYIDNFLIIRYILNIQFLKQL